MQSHYRSGSHRRDEEEYYEGYDDYEDEEGYEEEVEEQAREPVTSKEQKEFLSIREQLKEKIRQKMKEQTASTVGRQSPMKKKSTTNDKFGSFFGPSQPVIASRVLDERRSIQETSKIISRISSSSSGNTKSPASAPSEKKAHVQHQQPKVVNEVKKKAQTLKDMRDYSFLLSDDADDFPVPQVEEKRQPAARKPVPNSDVRSAQASSKVKPPLGKPSRPVPNGHHSMKSAANKLQPQNKVGSVKGAASTSRPRPTDNRKVIGANGINGGRPVGHKPVPSKASTSAMGANRPAPKVINDPNASRKVPPSGSRPLIQKNNYSQQKRPNERLDNVRTAPNRPPPSSKSQMRPPQKIPVRDGRERLREKPVKRKFDEDDDDNAIQMIRNMFGYNPNKYAGDDDDDSDMEAGFNQILKEERRSSKIAKEEDERELQLIEEEEKRERMRKKQKLSRR